MTTSRETPLQLYQKLNVLLARLNGGDISEDESDRLFEEQHALKRQIVDTASTSPLDITAKLDCLADDLDLGDGVMSRLLLASVKYDVTCGAGISGGKSAHPNDILASSEGAG